MPINKNLDFKNFLLEELNTTYNAYLCLPAFYQIQIESDFVQWRLYGSLSSEIGLYMQREAKRKKYTSDFTKWLKKYSVLSHDEFLNLPSDMKTKIYNQYYIETKGLD